MACKATLLMTVSTAPSNLAAAAVRVAGFSESLWAFADTVPLAAMQRWAQARAKLLPNSGRVSGYRLQQYTLNESKLIPGGSSAGSFRYPGVSNLENDLPQVALLCTAKGAATANSRRFTIRGIPDDVIVNGEYQPDADFRLAENAYLRLLQTDQWRFLGRNLADTSVKVVSVGGGVVTTNAAIPNLAVGQYVRLLKIKGDDGKPIQGSYRVTNIAGNAYTCENLDPARTSKNSGRIRRDRLETILIEGASVSRAVVRKVGRPFDQFHGRR